MAIAGSETSVDPFVKPDVSLQRLNNRTESILILSEKQIAEVERRIASLSLFFLSHTDSTAMADDDDAMMDFPLRPPTPFADSPTNEEPERRSTIVSPSPQSPKRNSWRRLLLKMLKRTKSGSAKKGVPSNKVEVVHPSEFGAPKKPRANSILVRSNSKRVHWMDDEETKLNVCHRFVEYLKLFVQVVIDEGDQDEIDEHLKQCQGLLIELNTVTDARYINDAFDEIVQRARRPENGSQLREQQSYIEDLISRSILSNSSGC